MILSNPGSLSYIPKKIISLVPSQTELLHYLGLENETIGITKFCVHPEKWFKSKIRIGGTKNISTEKIKSLHPDLIICNKEENDREQVENLAKDFPVWMTDVNNLEAALAMISDIGNLTGKEEHAANLIGRINENFKQLEKSIISPHLLNAAYLIWKDPYMTVGGNTFINDMLPRCGMKNIFSNVSRYPKIELSEIINANCNIVLLSSEPYPFNEKHIAEIQSLLPGLKIILAEGEMFSWYGSRLLEAPEYFRRLRKDAGFPEA